MQLKLVIWLFCFGISWCQTIDRDSANDYTNVTCLPNSASCTINCNNRYSCPETIHCPSNTSTGCSCAISCLANHACRGSTIYSYECATVSILVENDYGLASSNIYAPDNSGSLTITSDSGEYGFYQSTVHGATNTDSITIDCYNRVFGQEDSEHECIENTINALESNFLVFRCFEDAECGDNILYCPKNYQGFFQNTCSVLAQSSTVYGNSYNAIYGSGIVMYFLPFFCCYCCFSHVVFCTVSQPSVMVRFFFIVFVVLLFFCCLWSSFFGFNLECCHMPHIRMFQLPRTYDIAGFGLFGLSVCYHFFCFVVCFCL